MSDARSGFDVREGKAKAKNPNWKKQKPLGGSVPQARQAVIGGAEGGKPAAAKAANPPAKAPASAPAETG
jgi:hypothetical protein